MVGLVEGVCLGGNLVGGGASMVKGLVSLVYGLIVCELGVIFKALYTITIQIGSK